MNNKQKTMKRVMAVMLVLSMMLSTLDGYAPGLFTAFAEDAMEQAEAAPQENAASEEEIQKQEEAPKPEDDVERLEKLKQMLDKQLISQDDYDKVKNEILKKMIG